MELNNSEKVNAVISLSNRAFDETKRYRDHVWKMVVWTIALLVGVLAAANSRPDIAISCSAKWAGSIFIVIVAILGVWNLCFDYRQFIWNRNLQRDCERRLRFHDENVYGEKPLLPTKWRDEKYKLRHCSRHLMQWVFIITAVVVYCVYALWTWPKPTP